MFEPRREDGATPIAALFGIGIETIVDYAKAKVGALFGGNSNRTQYEKCLLMMRVCVRACMSVYHLWRKHCIPKHKKDKADAKGTMNAKQK